MDNRKKFDVILDECIENLLSGQKTVEQCLLQYPEQSNELEPLLRTAVIMQKAVDVKPSAEFRAKARYQMQLKMAQSPARVPVRPRLLPRWALAAGVAMMVFVLGGSTVILSAGVMPGNPLYAVKLGYENVQLALAGSPEKKAELYMNLADLRVNEISWMAANNKTQDMADAANRLDSYYNSIGALNMTASTQTAFSAANSGNHLVPTNGAVGLEPGATVTSTGGTDKNAATTLTVTATVTNTSVVVTNPPPSIPSTVTFTSGNPPATTSGNNNPSFSYPSNQSAQSLGGSSDLINELISNSYYQPNQIQALIDSPNVPESVKAVLRRALAASQAGYSNAINNFSNSGH